MIQEEMDLVEVFFMRETALAAVRRGAGLVRGCALW